MDLPPPSFAILALLSAAIPSVFTWLLTRAIKAVDKSIETLGAKVDGLGADDNKIRIELTELRARVIALELIMQPELHPRPRRGRR